MRKVPAVIRKSPSISILLVALLMVSRGDSPVDALTNVKIPLHDRDTQQLAGFISVARIQREYPKRGFFRLGLAPTVVAEDVNISIKDLGLFSSNSELVATALRKFSRSAPMEFRRINISSSGSPYFQVYAESARPDGRIWILHNGTVSQSNSRATFSTVRLVFDSAGLKLEATRSNPKEVPQLRFK